MPAPSLRMTATKKSHGPGANPSQLGDPISLKAETSDTLPTDEEAGAGPYFSSSYAYVSFIPPSTATRGETLREKAAKKMHGAHANPSRLGDPISLEAEMGPGMPGKSMVLSSKL
ncbi:hypothetical protein F4777DRAFT_209686 [Nemania sp. FL0916]|nr:hypothetical protein F4777DRAFT_209686 [Nemania sp. FL0916]